MPQCLARTLSRGETPQATVEDGILAARTAFLIDEATDARTIVQARWT